MLGAGPMKLRFRLLVGVVRAVFTTSPRCTTVVTAFRSGGISLLATPKQASVEHKTISRAEFEKWQALDRLKFGSRSYTAGEGEIIRQAVVERQPLPESPYNDRDISAAILAMCNADRAARELTPFASIDDMSQEDTSRYYRFARAVIPVLRELWRTENNG